LADCCALIFGFSDFLAADRCHSIGAVPLKSDHLASIGLPFFAMYIRLVLLPKAK
jgi:hypothetical protein